MARRTLDRTLLVASACAMLLSVAPATVDAWMERLNGTMGASRPASPTVIMEIPSTQGRNVAQGAPGSSLPLFSGMIVGILLGLLLGFRVLQGWQGRQRRQRDIERLTEEFQALFRKIDQEG